MKTVTGASIFLTEKCNLDCAYCFEKNKYGQTMSNEKLKQAIDFMFTNRDKHSNRLLFMWFGGEPLLNFEGLKYGVEYIKTKEKELSDNKFSANHVIITNGTICNDEVLEFLKNNKKISVQISWDGLPEVQNGQRGKSELVEANIEKFDTLENHVSVHPIITPLMVPVLEENFDYIINKFKNRKVNISPRFASGDDGEWLNDEKLYNDLFNGLVNVFEKYPNQISLITNCESAIKGEPNTCGAGKFFMSITPNGDLYACHRFYTAKVKDFQVGTLDDGFFTTPKTMLLEDYTMDNMMKCNECDAYQYCIRCIANNRQLTGEILCPGENYCVPSKAVFFAVLEYVKKHKPHLLANNGEPVVAVPAQTQIIDQQVKVNPDLEVMPYDPTNCPQNYGGNDQNNEINSNDALELIKKSESYNTNNIVPDDSITLTVDQKIEYVIMPMINSLIKEVDRLKNKKCNCKKKDGE